MSRRARYPRAAVSPPILLLALAVTAGACAPGGPRPPAAPPENGPPPAPPPSQGAFDGTTDPIEVERPQAPVALLTAVRTARHEGFDRIVLEFSGQVPGYHVEYLDAPAVACGSGEEVEIAGEALLEIRLSPVHAHTEEGEPTLPERRLRPGLAILGELVLTCDFEAVVTWVAGTAALVPYRVDELADPPRLVVDLAR